VCVNFIRELDTTETSCKHVSEVLAQGFQDLILSQSTCMPQEDKRALKMMEELAMKVNGHHQIALPWKNDKPGRPNNRPMVEKRVRG